MTAYLPERASVLLEVGSLLAALLLLGHLLLKARPSWPTRLAAWCGVVAGVVEAERLTAYEPPGFRMLALIGALLYGMKGVVTAEANALGCRRLSAWRWLAFASAWPGMRPAIFSRLGGAPAADAGRLIASGLFRLSLGMLLVASSRFLWLSRGSLSLTTLLLLPGLSLILHFGLFNIVAGLWRYAGVNAEPLFRDPLRSTSLTEFWGRRWNLAFSQMTALAVYQPIAARAGKRPATTASFLFSGLLHELAISVPVHSGYGLPSLYFAIHAVLMSVEDARKRQGRPIDRSRTIGRIWTLTWLLVPLPILFHRPFLAGVVWPLIGMHG